MCQNPQTFFEAHNVGFFEICKIKIILVFLNNNLPAPFIIDINPSFLRICIPQSMEDL